MLLLELGSGVRNDRRLFALPSDSSAFGVELMKKPSEVACENPAQIMCAQMWSVRMGDIELGHATMLESPRVNEPMAGTWSY